MRKFIANETLLKIVDRHNAGESISNICIDLGLKQPSVSKALKRNGLTVTPRKEANTGKHLFETLGSVFRLFLLMIFRKAPQFYVTISPSWYIPGFVCSLKRTPQPLLLYSKSAAKASIRIDIPHSSLGLLIGLPLSLFRVIA